MNHNELHHKWFNGQKPKFTCEKVSNLLKYSHKRINNHNSEKLVRFICISDIHTPSRIKKERIKWQFPPGDVLLVAGDLTLHGSRREVELVADWLRETPYSQRVVIAGNHDFCLDPDDEDYSPEAEAALKRECTYLRNSGTLLFDGIRVYGSPVTPEFHGMAFNVTRGDAIRQVWEGIPADTDILLTHGPPLGHGDLVFNGVRAGCADLLQCVERRARPAFHVFGHIHEAYGVTTNGSTAFVNAACCNLRYFLENQPLVFDYPLPGADEVAQAAAVLKPDAEEVQPEHATDDQLLSKLSLGKKFD